MGGDHGVTVCVPASVRLYRSYLDTRIYLFGDESAITKELYKAGVSVDDRLHIVHTSSYVKMEDHPIDVLRSKKNSSMSLAVRAVREGKAQACISAGNTGALMAVSRFLLRTLPGIERPAIATSLPTIDGNRCLFLDLGANVDCSSVHLFQFAVMGSVLASESKHGTLPRVGLLNVGIEVTKGNERIKEADRLLRQSTLNYLGYIEGDAIFDGKVDVLVTDGFTGNIALKAMEGSYDFIVNYVKKSSFVNWRRKIFLYIFYPFLRSVRESLDPRKYNGASILGLPGVVIKSHGKADEIAYFNALELARREAVCNIPKMLDKQFQVMF